MNAESHLAEVEAESHPDRRGARVALALGRHRAAAPPGVRPEPFAAAALADTYEVLADLVDVTAGVVGGDRAAVSALLWPGSLHLPDAGVADAVDALPAGVDHCVLVAGDAPDVPGLVLAKVFRALIRADCVIAPARNAPGCAVAVGVRVPWPAWLPRTLQLDDLTADRVRDAAPRRTAVATAPAWHRLIEPGDVARLDPGLEGWDNVRALLGGVPL